MKKLMIAAAIVCAAAASQAASVSWSSNNMSLTDEAGTRLNYQSAAANIVLVNLGQTIDWDNATVIPTGSDPGQNLMTVNTATTSKGGRLTGKVSFTWTGSGEDVVNSGDYLALMVIDDKGNLSKLTYTVGKTVAGDEAVLKVGTIANNGTNLTQAPIGFTGDFYAAAVPEPTSAMLLLLGVAGLALRRRRA